MNGSEAVLALSGVGKIFPGVVALDNVNFNLRAGEIHALLGENGAGKSTLIKVLTGVYQRDSGEVLLNGQSIRPANTGEAQTLGISTVYQEVNLLPNLTVAHNLFLGREPKRWGLIHWSKMNADASELLARYDLNIDVTQPLSSYSVAIQQLIAIARGVALSAKVLILDEPTASLDSDEVKTLFKIMRELKEQGMGIIFVTHFLDQVYAVCDRITILRNGQWVGDFESAKLPQQQLVSHMLGRELQQETAAQQQKTKNTDKQEALLRLNGAASLGNIHATDLNLAPGEVLGLAGLLGSGRTELCQLIFGASRLTQGDMQLNGKPLRLNSTREAVLAGFGMCPEDRKHDGILGPLSIRENIIIALQNKQGWWKYIAPKRQKEIADKFVAALKVATSDIEKPIEQLSGGNQQKVILARWLASNPILLILDEPTRGIDVGAHAEIIHLIRELCAQGLALIVASSELEELVEFSDRIVVLRDRKKVAELSGAQIEPQTIMQAIAGEFN